MTYAYITSEIAEELSIDVAPRVTVICETCGTTNHYYQDAPGHRCFDEVFCDKCHTVIGKT